jgi:hypothetical protein
VADHPGLPARIRAGQQVRPDRIDRALDDHVLAGGVVLAGAVGVADDQRERVDD